MSLPSHPDSSILSADRDYLAEVRMQGVRFNENVKILSQVGEFKYKYLVYQLMERGLVGVQDLAFCMDQSKARFYEIHQQMVDYLKARESA